MKKILSILVIGAALISIMACQFSVSPRIVKTEPSETSIAYTPAPTATRDFPLLQEPVPTVQPFSAAPGADEGRLAALYERINPGVVSIQVNSEQGVAQGSGFVFDGLGTYCHQLSRR